jgi:hypothetical protein
MTQYRIQSIHVDFSAPCQPDIHAMPAQVQAAGAAIRREIQQRHQKWLRDERIRRGQDRHAADQIEKYARKGMPHTPLPPAADRSQMEHRDLSDAYHAWAGTASPRHDLTPEMSQLLRSVVAA